MSIRQLVPLAAMATPLLAAAAFGATFTSTQMYSNLGGGGWTVQTQFRAAHNNILLDQVPTTNPVSVGATQTVLTVDTTTDTGHYDDIDFSTPSASNAPRTVSTFINYTLPVSPPNFPDPPTIITVSGQYSARITITSLVQTTPQYVSAPNAPITWNPDLLAYEHNPFVTYTMPDITLNGTYEAIGPTTTVTLPFSIVLRTSPSGNPVGRGTITRIPGASPFNNGFAYFPVDLTSLYSPTPGGVLFDQVVDNVRFVAEKPVLRVNYFAIPEPNSFALAVFAAGLGLVRLRRR